ncbi:MAG: 1-(5-phosphoribosyl)-5-[(5-phosphoribosylamino)methylideneamino]imidazole-4-carboxamide isomerase, partial [Candidatus Gracilibacteria bacterium]
MLIIPAIDIIGGKCVRLLRGDFSLMTEYSKDPLKVARNFQKAGASRIHVVDLEGAKKGFPVNREKILQIAQTLKIDVEVGGGIRNFETAESYLQNGVKKVILGSAALEDIALLKRLVRTFGSDRILVALDLRQGKIMTDGWLKESEKSCEKFLSDLVKVGVRELIFTDVDRDGTLTIPNLTFLKDLIWYGFNIILSGGVSDLRSIEAAREIGANGVIVGKAIYEKKIDLKEAVLRFQSGLTKRI